MKIKEIVQEEKNIVEYKTVPHISEERLNKFKARYEHKEVFYPENVLSMIERIYGSDF